MASPGNVGATTGVPADQHAQGLLRLGPQKWFLPVKAIALAAGFEGDTAVQQYRRWVGKLKRNPAVLKLSLQLLALSTALISPSGER